MADKMIPASKHPLLESGISNMAGGAFSPSAAGFADEQVLGKSISSKGTSIAREIASTLGR